MVDVNKLIGSIEKLFHYLLIHVKLETVVTVKRAGVEVFTKVYKPPSKILISSTLYSRVDNCHGAGNCCRVPFDLCYTNYDRNRIYEFNPQHAEKKYGKESAERFHVNRIYLLAALEEYTVSFKNQNSAWDSTIWVKRNDEIQKISGNKSCPYLFVGEDRYFCGIHLFKPLHCWMPHMTMRNSEDDLSAVNIGRLQYGRNHKFGCPVIFKETVDSNEGTLFEEPVVGETYFDHQYQDDLDKLYWVAESARSLGFKSSNNFAVDLHSVLLTKRDEIRMAIRSQMKPSVTLWSR